MSHKTAVLRGRIGAAVRSGKTDLAKKLRAEVRVERIEHQITEMLEGVELTQEQRDKLAALFHPSINAVLGNVDGGPE